MGRLCNLTQVFPELKADMQSGYNLTEATWVAGGRKRQPPLLAIPEGGETNRGWVELLDAADALLEGETGVALAPELSFPPRTLPGAFTVTSDASGKDGVGGFVFDYATPNVVYLTSEWWPADVQAALDAATVARTDRSSLAADGCGLLSMPAAETFGQWAVAEAAAACKGEPPTAITAVGAARVCRTLPEEKVCGRGPRTPAAQRLTLTSL